MPEMLKDWKFGASVDFKGFFSPIISQISFRVQLLVLCFLYFGIAFLLPTRKNTDKSPKKNRPDSHKCSTRKRSQHFSIVTTTASTCWMLFIVVTLCQLHYILFVSSQIYWSNARTKNFHCLPRSSHSNSQRILEMFWPQMDLKRLSLNLVADSGTFEFSADGACTGSSHNNPLAVNRFSVRGGRCLDRRGLKESYQMFARRVLDCALTYNNHHKI